jgi:hypothetical protein
MAGITNAATVEERARLAAAADTKLAGLTSLRSGTHTHYALPTNAITGADLPRAIRGGEAGVAGIANTRTAEEGARLTAATDADFTGLTSRRPSAYTHALGANALSGADLPAAVGIGRAGVTGIANTGTARECARLTAATDADFTGLTSRWPSAYTHALGANALSGADLSTAVGIGGAGVARIAVAGKAGQRAGVAYTCIAGLAYCTLGGRATSACTAAARAACADIATTAAVVRVAQDADTGVVAAAEEDAAAGPAAAALVGEAVPAT